MEQNELDAFLQWVKSTIDQYKDKTKMVQNGEVPPWEIQRLLSDYQQTFYGLLFIYQKEKRSISTLDRQFKAWWNSKISDARKELLSKMPAGKYPALKEYSIKAQEDNETEYNEWQEKIQEAQDRTDFLKMLLDNWNTFQNILINLNKNMCAELSSLSVEDREQRRVRQKKE